AAATLFAAGLAARLADATMPVLWCVSRRDLFAPGLAAVGLHPDLLVHVEAGNDTGVLRAVEEGVRHAGLAAVIGEVRRLPLVASRRLQLAAEASGVTVLMLLRDDSAAHAEPSAALTRWQIEAAPTEAGTDTGAGLARARWRVQLLRARGAVPADWLVEACDAQGRLAVPAALVDRPAAVEPRAHAA
ncbi:MAG: ImuA family protein, partial [Polymorphobacter sp.]